MSAHHIEVTLSQDGKLTLDELPFSAGDTVEVIILGRQTKPNGREYPLRGQRITYVDPTEPVGGSEPVSVPDAKRHQSGRSEDLSKNADDLDEPIRADDPIFNIGRNPVSVGTSDASENHDKYLYGDE